MNIFRTTNYRTIIAQLLKERKAKEPSFGLTALAEQIGVQNTYISRVINGTRDFSTDQLHALAKVFDLESDERHYLMLLLEYERTGLAWRKRELHREIGSLQTQNRAVNQALEAPKVDPGITDSMAMLYIDPSIALVMHFLTIPRYQKDNSLIMKELGLSTFQFKRAIESLEKAQVIRAKPKGGFEILLDRFHMDTASALTIPYVTALRQLTIQQIQRIPKDEKVNFSATFTADEATRVAIHESFLKFLKETEALVQGASPDEVYQINFDLFPWSIR